MESRAAGNMPFNRKSAVLRVNFLGGIKNERGAELRKGVS